MSYPIHVIFFTAYILYMGYFLYILFSNYFNLYGSSPNMTSFSAHISCICVIPYMTYTYILYIGYFLYGILSLLIISCIWVIQYMTYFSPLIISYEFELLHTGHTFLNLLYLVNGLLHT